MALQPQCAGFSGSGVPGGSRGPEHGLRGCGSGLSGPAARGVFQDQGSNPCLLHWQVALLPQSHQGSPLLILCVFFLAVLLQVWSLGQKHHVGVGKTCTLSGPRPQISEPRTGSHLSMFYWALQAVRCMPGFENPWSASVPVSCVQKAGLPPAVSHFTGPPGSSRPVPQRWVFTALEPPLP